MSGQTLGIDPGLTGALALVEGEELRWAIDMPTANGEVSPALLAEIYCPEHYGPWDISYYTEVAIERVSAMPKQGVASTFKFGTSYGMMFGYFFQHRITRYTPSTWKTSFKLTGKPKDAARALAIELWPQHADLFKLKAKGQARADAALVALHHNRIQQWHAV